MGNCTHVTTWHNRLGPFATRSFLALTIGGLLSAIGSSAASVTLVWFVLSSTHSPVLVSVVLSCYFGARIIAQVFTGVIADRLNRGRVMLLGDLLSGFLYVAVALLVISPAFQSLDLIPLYILLGLSCQLYPVSVQAALPDLVPQEDLVRANAGMQACLDSGSLVGPAVGAILIGTVGPTWAFAANAISYFLSVSATIFGRVNSRPDRQPQRILQDLGQGLNELARNRVLGLLCIVGLIVHIAVIPIETVLMGVLVKDVLHASVITYGVAITCLNVGALACGVGLSLVRLPFSAKSMLLIGCSAEGVGVIGLGIAPSSWILWMVAAFYGAAGSLLFAYVLAVVQQSTAASIRGRAFSAVYLGVEIGSVVGLAVVGPLIPAFGARDVMIGMGILIFLTLPLVAAIRDNKMTPSVKGEKATAALDPSPSGDA